MCLCVCVYMCVHMHTQRVCMNAHTKCVYEYAYKEDITSLDATSEQQEHAVAPSSQHTLSPLSVLSLAFFLSLLLSRSSHAPWGVGSLARGIRGIHALDTHLYDKHAMYSRYIFFYGIRDT